MCKGQCNAWTHLTHSQIHTIFMCHEFLHFQTSLPILFEKAKIQVNSEHIKAVKTGVTSLAWLVLRVRLD